MTFTSFFQNILSLLINHQTMTTTTTTKIQEITTSTTSTTTGPNIITGGKKMKTALCIGINKYPTGINPLYGCVNDALDNVQLLKEVYGFDEVKTLFDSDATKINVTSTIAEMLAKSPDVFVITNSSHGTRVPDINGIEADGYCEAICLFGSNMEDFLIDHDFKKLLDKADPKTHVTVISDSCHSAGVTREFLKTMNDSSYVSTPKYMPPKDNMEALSLSMMPISKAIFEPEADMNNILIAGCRSDQYSYDASFGKNRPNGAFTYYFLQIVRENPNITYGDLITKMNQYLPSSKYPQCPVLQTNDIMKNLPIFS